MIALMRMVSGLALWAAAFAALYALHGLACSLGWNNGAGMGAGLGAGAGGPLGLSPMRFALIAVWLAFLALHAGLILWLRRTQDDAMGGMARAIAWIGGGATFVTGIPSLVISTCV